MLNPKKILFVATGISAKGGVRSCWSPHRSSPRQYTTQYVHKALIHNSEQLASVVLGYTEKLGRKMAGRPLLSDPGHRNKLSLIHISCPHLRFGSGPDD